MSNDMSKNSYNVTIEGNFKEYYNVIASSEREAETKARDILSRDLDVAEFEVTNVEVEKTD